MRAFLRQALLVVAFGLGSYAFGWWAVPVIGGLWGLINPTGRHAALRAGMAAAASWAILLLVPAITGAPLASFAAQLAGAMQVPAWALVVVELAFPLAVAWSAAALGAAVRGGAGGGSTP
ncbi:MAG: hypothetical protein B7Z72_14725 [Gemmatimonadetes bacterium 21-71-4]|nr:MAG: hypothetical protein B7Z72_14725 [Gemmatimonadetes bacterium 21-71-4]